jgi:hypothetical protein
VGVLDPKLKKKTKIWVRSNRQCSPFHLTTKRRLLSGAIKTSLKYGSEFGLNALAVAKRRLKFGTAAQTL